MNSKLKAFLMAAGLSSAAITGAQLTDKWEGNSLTVYVDAVGVLTACPPVSGLLSPLNNHYF
ncbi:hypothetical protein [Shewanella xiamenensis]|uniref:hypothetical protein n=1 Tax=Shewanella xiamenensis TaxID=332186 RepID=UPI002E7B6269|nr:hypothetical protein [Shewanella xiamenensis]MEE1981338.1 hypothetical protein [Shewanella xiamenensis]